MSSRFSARPTGPTQPPICRKSVPEGTLPVWPPNIVQAWFTIEGLTTSGVAVSTNQVFYANRQPVANPQWSRRWTRNDFQWELFYGQIIGSEQFEGALQAIHPPSGGFLIATIDPHTPISLEPFNSGIQQPNVTTGSGSATTRILL